MMPKKAIATRFRLWRSAKASRSGVVADLALLLQFGEGGAFGRARVRIQTEIGEQDDRGEERDAPAPGEERLLAEPGAGGEDDQQRREQAERGRGLDPAGRRAALVVGGMLGDVDGGAAIFAAQRGSLADAQEDEQDRGEDAGLAVGRQQADGEGGAAHQADGDEEGRLAADAVAHRPEHDRAQRAKGEAGGEQAERGDQRRGRVEPGEEDLGDDLGRASRR